MGGGEGGSDGGDSSGGGSAPERASRQDGSPPARLDLHKYIFFKL